MQYQLWTDECRRLLDRHQQLLDAVCAGIADSTEPAFVREEGGPALTGTEAREAIVDHLQCLQYNGEEKALSGITAPHLYMACACDQPTLELIGGLGGLNHAKMLFKDFHERLRAEMNSQVEGTQALREVLALCEVRLLNVEAVDRRLPLFYGQAVRLNWLINRTSPSARRSLVDAMHALAKLQENAAENRVHELDKEISALQQLPADTPVAHRMRKPISSLKVQVHGLDTLTNRRTKMTLYAKNPVFYLAGGMEPERKFPDEVGSGNGGRPSTISDNRVSPSLANWFFYKPESLEPAPKPVPTGRRRRNPHASTAIPGIWFSKDRLGRPCFSYLRPNGNRSTVSIKPDGEGGGFQLESAWQTVIDRSWPEKPQQEREKAYAMVPQPLLLQAYIDSVSA